MCRAVFIYGPTAVGKTDFANTLAEHISGEIINIDAGQLYIPLTIGTAKPLWQNEQIPHHMFDVCSQPSDYSVAEYRKAVLSILPGIIARGNIPIFVGGSGFYMSSLLFPPFSHETDTFKDKDDDNAQYSWTMLQSVDPVRAAAIHPHDRYRIRRALLLYQQTNTPPSQLKPQYCPIIDPFFIFLNRPVDSLKTGINDRITQMIQDGWLEEVQGLINTPWESFILKKKFIGYSELIAYCGDNSLTKEISTIADAIGRATWHYARRQLSYARMFIKKIKSADPSVPLVTINLTSSNLELYINELTKPILLSQKGLFNE